MLWYYVSIACIFQLNNCINWYLNADTSLSKGCRTTRKTSDEVIKEDNWGAGGRKKAAAWIGFFYSPFFSLKLSELLKYLMKIVLLHFGLSNQLEEDLVPGWRCCLFWRYDFIHLVFTEVLTEFSFSLPPCEPSSRAGSTWQGAWSSSQEQGLRLFPSVGIFPPLSCSHWSAWPPFQDGTSHKLS